MSDPVDCSPPGSSPHGIFQASYWSGLPFPPPGDLPDSGIEPGSPALQADSLRLSYLPHVLPPPRILLDDIHLAGAMCAPPGRTLSQNDWPRKARNESHHHKARNCEPRGRAVLLGSFTLLLSARGPFALVCQLVCLLRQFISKC